jgi:cyclophilin family peptidyl-prolyl cis-trans isomerase/HEAT repeat protein
MQRAAAILTIGLAAAAARAAQVPPVDTPLSHDPELAQVVRLRDGAATRRSDPRFTESVEALLRSTRSAQVLGALPYIRAEQVQLAEARLLAQAKDDRTSYPHVSRAFEALVRRNRRLWTPSDETLAFLRHAALRELPGMEANDHQTPELGMAALNAAGVVDADIAARALGDEAWSVRRVAALALAAAGTRIETAQRTDLIRQLLRDRAWQVRFEALRAWGRSEAGLHGCGPLVAALSDESPHVVLAALDMLGERCLDEVEVTDRMIAEARAPPTIGPWHREAHAMVALAKRDPERAALSLPIFVHHPVWQVRLYAARAAAAMKDVYSLGRLAYDTHDNVREAALPALRLASGPDSDAACIAALGRRDYQLLRTVALLLKDAAPDRYMLAALIDALARVTAEKKETSRDTRLALVERIRAMGGRPRADVFERLLRDFDPVMAAAAADAYAALTGRNAIADPQRLPRRERLLPSEPPGPTIARVELDTGRYFEVAFDKKAAPLAYTRFRRLIDSRYFDGLTFHRVEPNFVIQGGSPAANEYAGDDRFMVDELGRAHLRGTVGISTRGRDTGDAQFFVNLVDNPRLDLEYTVFASVQLPHMDVVDEIQEGATIRSIRFR